MNIVFPQDIIEKIQRDFSRDIQKEAVDICKDIYSKDKNVGNEQSVRGALYLAKGEIAILKAYNQSLEKEDPRDVLEEAEIKAGNYGHYFSLSFDEIEELEKSVKRYCNRLAKEEEERENLPPEFYEE
jgi:hypothetical protein